MRRPFADLPVAVLGAGPHGLSAVAHLRAAGVPTIAFGEPLGFWRETMPAGMMLRSSPAASSISSPGGALSLAAWALEHSRELPNPLPVGEFVEYGMWFAQQAVPGLDRRLVSRVRRSAGGYSAGWRSAGGHGAGGGSAGGRSAGGYSAGWRSVGGHGAGRRSAGGRNAGGFVLTLSDGEELAAGRVIVATGIGPFAEVPEPFSRLPSSLVSHTAATPDLERFAGRSVAVIGAGQSALESAALLHELGAQPQVIARARAIFWLGKWSQDDDGGGAVPSTPAPARQTWRARRGLYWRSAPTEVGGRLSSWVGAAPDVMRGLPGPVRRPLTYRCIRPAGAYWLPQRLREVDIALSRRVVDASEAGGRARLRLDDGSTREVDHVLLGTGYRIDVRRYPFLDGELLRELKTVAGSPALRRGLESSVPGLHFTGALAAESFGPAMRFVVGTAYTGPALAQRVLGNRRPLLRWAF